MTRFLPELHAEVSGFVDRNKEALSRVSLLLRDRSQRAGRIHGDRERLRSLRLFLEKRIQIFDELINVLMGEAMTATPLLERLQGVRRTPETVQPVLPEERSRIREQRHDFADPHRSRDARSCRGQPCGWVLRFPLHLPWLPPSLCHIVILHAEIPILEVKIPRVSVSKALRIFASITLPLLTLLLGWQLGVRYEQNVLQETRQQLDLLYSGQAGSGQLVTDPEKEVDISLLWTVWRLLLQHYIAPDELSVTPLLFGAVEGLVRGVRDPYTVFMTPKENRDFHEALEGKLQGIGAELTMRDGLVVVVAPLKGSPAEKAGLLPEDVIVAVDEKDVDGETLNQVVQRIRGPKGTEVQLTVAREGESDPLKFTIMRDDIHVPSVESKMLKTASGSVGYVALNQFGDTAIEEVENALESFRDEALGGIVLDLRFNGGGYLDGAVALTSLFLKQGKVVSVQRRGKEPDHHYVYGRPAFADIPLVVLINQGSASASEIVAGALQDHERATVVGKKSFGKGTVQEVLDLPGGGSLRVTTAQWLLPSGRNLGKEGVDPDIEVDRTREDFEADRDPQLDTAIKVLLDGGKREG